MKKTLTCIICPRGCTLEATQTENRLSITGNACPKGEKYAIDELTCPMRTVTSTVRIANRKYSMVSVKTAEPVKKEHIFDVMKLIRSTNVNAPVHIGDTILSDVYGTDIIATKTVE